MSSVSSAAFYQFFRDRETVAGAQRAEGGDASRKVAPDGATGQAGADQAADAGRAAGSTALAPAQVRGRLDALIAGQLAAGKLTSGQAAALRQALGQNAPQDAAPQAAATAQAAPADAGLSSTGSPEGDGAWNPSEVLATFIQNLQGGQARRAGYGSDGSAPARDAGSRLLDFNT